MGCGDGCIMNYAVDCRCCCCLLFSFSVLFFLLCCVGDLCLTLEKKGRVFVVDKFVRVIWVVVIVCVGGVCRSKKKQGGMQFFSDRQHTGLYILLLPRIQGFSQLHRPGVIFV